MYVAVISQVITKVESTPRRHTQHSIPVQWT